MPAIANGKVSFDTVAREWRLKYTGPAPTSVSLEACQAVLEEYLPALKALDGVKDVKRVVCGGCLDFKIVTALDAEKFGEWESAAFAPETDVVAKLTAIEGVSAVETQTYTFMSM